MKQEKEDCRAFHAARKVDQERGGDPIEDDLPDGKLLVGVGFGGSALQAPFDQQKSQVVKQDANPNYQERDGGDDHIKKRPDR